MKRAIAVFFGLLLVLTPTLALAVEPNEMLADPKLEARAEAIGNSLRCLVCQDESIEASSADLAHDLRVLVRQRLAAGDTDQQVKDYIVSRYGEFVLLQPVFALHTLLLWLTAPGLVVIGGLILFWRTRRRRESEPDDLTAEEAAALQRLEQSGPGVG